MKILIEDMYVITYEKYKGKLTFLNCTDEVGEYLSEEPQLFDKDTAQEYMNQSTIETEDGDLKIKHFKMRQVTVHD